jgi:hypothetical protein
MLIDLSILLKNGEKSCVLAAAQLLLWKPAGLRHIAAAPAVRNSRQWAKTRHVLLADQKT